jgi:hypothetical protein
MAAVIPLFGVRPNSAQSDIVQAEHLIRRALSSMPQTIVAQACARAARLIRAGKCWSLSADQAIKWARGAVHPEPPEAA